MNTIHIHAAESAKAEPAPVLTANVRCVAPPLILGTKIINRAAIVYFVFLVIVILIAIPGCTTMQLITDPDLLPGESEAQKLTDQGQYAAALKRYDILQALADKRLGNDNEFSLHIIRSRAFIHLKLGDGVGAERLYSQMAAISSKRYGDRNQYTISALAGLAQAYQFSGKTDLALATARHLLTVFEQASTEDVVSPENVNNLAIVFSQSGDYATAQVLWKRSAGAHLKQCGNKQCPPAVTPLLNLADLFITIGDYSSAEDTIQAALANSSAKVLQSTTGVTLYSAAARVAFCKGDKEKADQLYATTLARAEAVYGSDSIETARILNNYGGMLPESNPSKAESLLLRALVIRERHLNKNHPHLASSLNNLGTVYSRQRDYAKAEQYHRRALAIFQRSLGEWQVNTAIAHNNLGSVLALRGKFIEAHASMLRSQASIDAVISAVFDFGSEQQQMAFLSAQRELLDSMLGIALLSKSSGIPKDTLEVWFRRKGMVLEVQKSFNQALLDSTDPKVMQVSQQLNEVRGRLSGLVLTGPEAMGQEKHTKALADLTAQKNRLEHELSILSHGYSQAAMRRRVTVAQVSKALPHLTALIEFVRFTSPNYKPKSNKDPLKLPPHYAAFVLRPGAREYVRMVDLGEASVIEHALTQLREATAGPNVNPLDLKEMKLAQAASTKLRNLVFAPLQSALGGANELFISPDGALNLLPFEILADASGRYLIQDYTINYLDSGRDLIGSGLRRGSPGPALIMGNPEYDLDAAGKQTSLTKLQVSLVSGKAKPLSRSFNALRFEALPDTQKEVDTIRAVLGPSNAEYHTGAEALEELLTSRSAPRILHLATHGFLLKDETLPSKNSEQSIGSNPLTRAGFALGGANTALATGNTGPGDGLVTAEKILGLNLQGTELVVLSACESGLGEVTAGEGVFGLRRAFAQAGAQSIVMSMWSVSDTETQELMTAFYKNIQSGRMNRAQALRQAALNEQQIVSKRYGHANPFFWGAFIFAGER